MRFLGPSEVSQLCTIIVQKKVLKVCDSYVLILGHSTFERGVGTAYLDMGYLTLI